MSLLIDWFINIITGRSTKKQVAKSMSQKDFTKEVASKSSRKSNSKIRNHLLIFLKTGKHLRRSLSWDHCCQQWQPISLVRILFEVNASPRKS